MPAGVGASRPYISKPDHHDGSADKSQWSIAAPQEAVIFDDGYQRGWRNDIAVWGLCLASDQAQYLGHSARSYGPIRDLFVAYFQLAAVSHGYPCDTVRRTREIPPDAVRADWLRHKYIRAKTLRKLGRGQPCEL